LKDLYVVFNKDNTVRTYSYSGRDRSDPFEPEGSPPDRRQ
jgi:hypothetical protein